jgi:hypothetical protein
MSNRMKANQLGTLLISAMPGKAMHGRIDR